MLFTASLTLGGAVAGTWYTLLRGLPMWVPVLTLLGSALTVFAMVMLVSLDPGQLIGFLRGGD